jgi:hypothetical protein
MILPEDFKVNIAVHPRTVLEDTGWDIRGINLGARRRCLVNPTLRQKDPVTTAQDAGSVHGRSGRVGKVSPLPRLDSQTV